MGACESCFGWHLDHLMENDFLPSTCTLEWDDECRDEITFFVHDKDGNDRTLVVNQENWADAYESWSRLLAKQEDARV
jgi:hypothetical protein